MKKIVVVAQTPPPFHGQAIMQQYTVQAKWTWCEKEHVRLSYSDHISEVGRFQLSKLLRLVDVLKQIRRVASTGSIAVLYYPPAGPQRVPLYRDIITLLFAKRFAKRIVLHFHAGGLSELISRLTFFERLLARRAFRNIDTAIVLLPWLAKEVEWFSPKKTVVIPNGIEDVAYRYKDERVQHPFHVLFVGNLKNEKGIFVLLEAMAKLKAAGRIARLRIMGGAHSADVQRVIERTIDTYSLRDYVDLLGTLDGEAKWKEFAAASAFCLPTFASEGMPVSIMEAMMFSLPVVTTDWRGIPDMITHGEEGLLVPVKDANKLSDGLAYLMDHPQEACEMGNKARRKFVSLYSIDQHLSRMEEAIRSTAL